MVKVAILTSGGDSQGMNSAVRAIVRSGIAYGFEMVGILEGYKGLMEKKFISLTSKEVSEILYRGGTFLGSARSEEFRTEAGLLKAVQNLKEEGVDTLVVIGGDGSYHGALELKEKGIKTIGLPGTIDNDISFTDYTIGFDTTVNIVTEAIGKIRDTMSSHHRVSVIEVMGRGCGDIALHAGIASGADVVLIPEVEWNIEDVCRQLQNGFKNGKTHGIVVVAEGASSAEKVAEMIRNEAEDLDVRATVLGHIQRGGSPSAFDRILTSRFGDKVIDLIAIGMSGMAIGIEDNKITYHKFEEVLNEKYNVNLHLYRIANNLSI